MPFAYLNVQSPPDVASEGVGGFQRKSQSYRIFDHAFRYLAPRFMAYEKPTSFTFREHPLQRVYREPTPFTPVRFPIANTEGTGGAPHICGGVVY
jgi:hypothetical protein